MEIVTKIAPICLALIMLALGLGLKASDFLKILKNPKDFSIGIICQLILLPIVAYILILIIKPPLEIAVGLMIISAAPGGVTTNVLTKFANGDVALSISLTAFVSLISIVSVPFIVFSSINILGATNFSTDISMTSISLKMLIVVTLPVLIGMIIRNFAENFIQNKVSLINNLTYFFFAIVFFAILVEERKNLLFYIEEAGFIVLLLNIIMMIIAFYIAKKFASGIKQRKCISLECGLQNGTLAIFVTTQIFDDVAYLVPTAAYALIMYLTGFIFIYLLKNSTSN